MKIGIINISDRASKGIYEDLPGKSLRSILTQHIIESIDFEYVVIPDEQQQIASILEDWSDRLQCNIIFTCGGTGLTPRDVTPEATLSVAHKIVPGIPELLRYKGAQHIATAMLSRQVAVIRNNTLIINFPGSVKAQEESFMILKPILRQAVQQVNNATFTWRNHESN